jgi:hypothetical protein
VIRRPALVLLLLAVAVLVAALAAPPTRAALLALFARVGAIEIFVDDTAPLPVETAVPVETAGPPPTALPATITGTDAPLGFATPLAEPPPRPVVHSLSLLDLGEPVTPAEAARRVGFVPQLPTSLPQPDAFYLHRGVDLPAVTLVWRDGATTLSLTEIGILEFARKLVHEQGIQETTVRDAPAFWLPGPHSLELLGPWQNGQLLIASNVLIWTQDGITYRLEGSLSLDEARGIAESVALPEGE